MFKKKITYTDFDGNSRTEEFLFNMNKAEIVKWMTTDGDYAMDKVIERLSQERNGKKIMAIFEDLIDRSYGVKSMDGRRFTKNPEVLADFKETEAYSIFFMELCSDTKAAIDFIMKIVPEDMVNEIIKAISENSEGIPAEIADYTKEIPKDASISPTPLFINPM